MKDKVKNLSDEELAKAQGITVEEFRANRNWFLNAYTAGLHHMVNQPLIPRFKKVVLVQEVKVEKKGS